MATQDSSQPDPALLGILTLLAAERAERDPKATPATEVLLARVGLSHEVIGAIVDKKPDTVRKAAERAGKPGTKKGK